MVEVSFLTEDDADVMRYIGPEPESGSVLLRCCGCGTWLKPDRSQMQTFCNQQCWTCEQEDCLQWRRELFENDENCRKLLEPPIIRHIRHRNATDTSQKLKLSIMKVISHYCQLPTGFIKEERVCTHQNEDQMVSAWDSDCLSMIVALYKSNNYTDCLATVNCTLYSWVVIIIQTTSRFILCDASTRSDQIAERS